MLATVYFTPMVVPIVFMVLFLAEKRWPLRHLREPLLHRIFVNFIVTIPMLLAAMLFVHPIGMSTLHWAQQSHFGLLRLISLPSWVQFVVGFLLMDLTFYYWHLLNHRIPILWRFHNVHHVDPDLDVTTAARFHYGEVIYSVVFRVLQLGLLGISPLTFIVYESVFQIGTLFHHSNLKLPIRFERILNKIFVTPRMHGIHHSQILTELNSNFSVVFSGWDRLHKTLQLNIPQQQIIIGVAAYQTPDTNQVINLLILPFIKQRQYSLLPNNSLASRTPNSAKTNFLLE